MLKKLIGKYLLRKVARSYGIIDPVSVVNQLEKFAEPSEIDVPLELLRAGIIFHARGLINTKAIQHNLDWVWPYWVERQFDPEDVSFIPRAFSFTHVNLTHRNWTAVGLPDIPLYPLVDPRGLVTPFYDGWSIDFWIIDEKNRQLFPSRLPSVDQQWVKRANPSLMTVCEQEAMCLATMVSMSLEEGIPRLKVTVQAVSDLTGRLVVALRPYNPEGVQFINKIAYEHGFLRINSQAFLTLSRPPERVFFSDYRAGDVLHQLRKEGPTADNITCETGMATAAAIYPLSPGKKTEIFCTIALDQDLKKATRPFPNPNKWDKCVNKIIPYRKNAKNNFSLTDASRTWRDALSEAAALRVPDQRLQQLYESSVLTLIHLTAGEPVPGPYTYKRFWFRDACFMLNALLALGLTERTLERISRFPARQQRSGYYLSQSGEWDSNGQVLWLVHRFQQCTGRDIDGPLLDSVIRGAAWIKAKIIGSQGPYRGLLPSGFSAEHFGPNDYYYWDDFWAVAGLRGAAQLAARHRPEAHSWIQSAADDLYRTVTRSIEGTDTGRSEGGIPASPTRRLDAGAIGSLVADYPLQLLPANDPRIAATVEFLLSNCLHRSSFFQDIIHSGINSYLTLALAQTLLRCGDDRYRKLVHSVAGLATSTGQWPEAIHPATGGGCMGDGEHGWAVAEWIMMMRHLFIREEGGEIVIGSGIFPEWLEEETVMGFGPTPTPFGSLKVEIISGAGRKTLRIDARWHDTPPALRLIIPGWQCRKIAGEENLYLLERMTKDQ